MRRILVLAALVLLTGCQTAPQPKAPAAQAEAPQETTAPAPTEPAPLDASSIAVDNTGFSPKAQSPANTLGFRLHFGSQDQIVSWKVSLVDADGTEQKSFADTAPKFPPTLSWDGLRSDGQPAPEGRYVAHLSVDYGRPDGPLLSESAPFLLDLTPPSGSITADPDPFSPGNPEVMVGSPQVTIAVNLVPGTAAITSWRLGVMHPDGRRFMDFINEDHKDNRIVWNGRAQNNAAPEAGIVYQLVAQVFDQYGNQGLVTGTLKIAEVLTPAAPPVETPSPVTVVLDGKLVAATLIYFPAYSSDLSKVDTKKAALNAEALQKLADALKPVAGAHLVVTGHANQVFWQDGAKGAIEQREVLIPLSLARAQAVRDALVARGADPGLFEVKGVGAEDPAVPFGDLVNNWKNRRVEFTSTP